MDWLWLAIFILGLVILWAAIVGLEKLIERVNHNDDQRRANTERLAKKIERAESEMLRAEAAKDFIRAARVSPDSDPDYVPQEFIDAYELLDGEELLEAMAERTFGAEPDSEAITADQSAFASKPTKPTVVASGGGVLPIKSRSAKHEGLSKKEEKMFKKIKQGG